MLNSRKMMGMRQGRGFTMRKPFRSPMQSLHCKLCNFCKQVVSKLIAGALSSCIASVARHDVAYSVVCFYSA